MAAHHVLRVTLKARETTLERVVQETGAEVVHPYNDDRVIAGQGRRPGASGGRPRLDAVMIPVGGGGLLSGTAIAATSLQPASG